VFCQFSYTYFNDDQVRTVTSPDPDPARTGPGYDPQVTSYVYDSAGRVASVTQPDGGVVNTTYWPTGAVQRTWGSRTYPVEYSYSRTEGVWPFFVSSWLSRSAREGGAWGMTRRMRIDFSIRPRL